MNITRIIDREQRYGANNYSPLPVAISRAQGVWVEDCDGKRYLDMMSAYSAVSHGHAHPRIVAAAIAQLQKVSVVSRAFHSETLGHFLEALCEIAGFEAALPMNSGAEAVETAIKAARRWGYRVKGIARDKARIVTATDNFHGRTSTIVGFSTEAQYKDGFGPFSDGFDTATFGDIDSFRAVIGPDTCAVLIEPIQGEAGIRVPPQGFLRQLRELCDASNTLLILDEIQSGLGRTGKTFAFEHEGIRPDGLIVGKALGGGILPVSAFIADHALMDLFDAGSHGSTFGGNPLAAAVGLEALRVLQDEQLAQNSAELGAYLQQRLREMAVPFVRDIRGRGLWVGIELDRPARPYCEALMALGVLAKETHETVLRIAPPLCISREELDWGLERIAQVLVDR